MTDITKEERREFYRRKNEARRANKNKTTLYAESAREARKGITGFGKTTPSLFNRLAEGTKAPRRAEVSLDPKLKLSAEQEQDLIHHAYTGE